MSSASRNSGRRAALWLLVPPAMAMMGGFITLFLALKFPDQALKVEKVSTVTTDAGTHQHVTNSVTPPLQ